MGASHSQPIDTNLGLVTSPPNSAPSDLQPTNRTNRTCDSVLPLLLDHTPPKWRPPPRGPRQQSQYLPLRIPTGLRNIMPNFKKNKSNFKRREFPSLGASSQQQNNPAQSMWSSHPIRAPSQPQQPNVARTPGPPSAQTPAQEDQPHFASGDDLFRFGTSGSHLAGLAQSSSRGTGRNTEEFPPLGGMPGKIYFPTAAGGFRSQMPSGSGPQSLSIRVLHHSNLQERLAQKCPCQEIRFAPAGQSCQHCYHTLPLALHPIALDSMEFRGTDRG